jgi:hypothetical protein
MTVTAKATNAVAEIHAGDELPGDLCDTLEEAWKVRLAPETRDQIEFALKSFAYEQQGQGAREANAQAGTLLDAIAACRTALSKCGKDLKCLIERELNPDDDDPLFPVLRQMDLLDRKVRAAREKLPAYGDRRGSTILGPLTRLLAGHYREAAGRAAGTRVDSPFVRGVLVAHDALPLRLQEQNAGAPAETPREQLKRREPRQYRAAVREALVRMSEEAITSDVQSSRQK